MPTNRLTFDVQHEHPWDVTPKEAVAIQRRLAGLVRVEPLTQAPETIAGLDVSVRGDRVQAAVVVLRLPELEVLDEAIWRGPVAFPYVSGLLSFREVPAILPALRRLQVRPDVLMTDSQGLAHPRGMGLACHLGVLLDWPTLGVAKTRLTGVYDEPGPEKGDRALLYKNKRPGDPDAVIGTVLRTRTNVKPVYVSVGHRMTLDDAVALTLACTDRYKLPETTRLAHHLSRRQKEAGDAK